MSMDWLIKKKEMEEIKEAIMYAKTEADLYNIRQQINSAFKKKNINETERRGLWNLLKKRSERIQGSSKRIY